jgi:CHAT domain-containing protein/tetratricopeptide (TPR) repeat protein
LAETWAAQILPDMARVAESRRRLAAVIADAGGRRFRVLLSRAYYWFGSSDYRQSELSQSNRRFKTALRIAEAGNNLYEAHQAREALALNYSKLGELEPALAYASQMLPGADLYYRSFNQSWRDKGTLADLALRLKHFNTSLSFSKEALASAQEFVPESGRVMSSLRAVVTTATAKEDYDSALKYAAESMRIARGRGDGSENTQLTAETYLLLANIKSGMKDCDAALKDYDRALELYARLPELTVNSYQIHKGKMFCFRQLGRGEDFASELKTVLGLSEKYRATIREDDSRRAFFAKEQVVYDAAAADALERLDARGAFELVETSRARSLLDFVESDKPIAGVERDFASVARPLSLTEIQARLPERVQLVQYAVLPDRLAIWVVSRTRFELFDRPITAARLEEMVDAYQALVVGRAPAPEVARAGRELQELLMPPGLDATRPTCLIPDKSLHRLSFASLVSPSGSYLLEDYALFYAPSASLLVLASENARRKERAGDESLLSVGNPDFDREENPGLPDLRAAEDEAQRVADRYQKTQALLGGEATKERFLRDFEGVEVIHFAGHFVANGQSPGNSKLLFAGGELRSSELGTHKLPLVKLVILSACQTGVVRYDKGEGAVGVARTFLALGAPQVVASQWQVDSESTEDLMDAFHRNRKEQSLTSVESLRRAQLEVLKNERTSAPFYWAAFSLFGGYANY